MVSPPATLSRVPHPAVLSTGAMIQIMCHFVTGFIPQQSTRDRTEIVGPDLYVVIEEF